ncbi:hypothetical protein AWENTII_000244 [Aspergillus wentii]
MGPLGATLLAYLQQDERRASELIARGGHRGGGQGHWGGRGGIHGQQAPPDQQAPERRQNAQQPEAAANNAAPAPAGQAAGPNWQVDALVAQLQQVDPNQLAAAMERLQYNREPKEEGRQDAQMRE